MVSWQYKIREQYLEDDLKELNLTKEDIAKLKTSDFLVKSVEEKEEQKKMVDFIKKYEWLGTISQYTTHWYGAYYNGILSGVVLFNVPNSFSKMLGKDTHKKERLISRGACASWTPKNLASYMITKSIKDIVRTTDFRIFSCYADPEAYELGTIYQACNFYYLGNNFGTKVKLVNPFTGKVVSDRAFRQKTFYKKIAKQYNINWESSWCTKNGMNWDNVPDKVEKFLRVKSKELQEKAQKFDVKPKHKYVYVLGRNKKETKELRRQFLNNVRVYEYPKIRGDVPCTLKT